MQKNNFIEMVKRSRSELAHVLRKIDIHHDFNTKINEYWTVKDLIAHIVWYEKEAIFMIVNKDITRNSEIWDKPQDARNQLVYNLIKNQTEDQVKEDFKKTGEELINILTQIDQVMYEESSLYKGMPKEWVPLEIIDGNTHKHYDDHLKALKRSFSYLN